MTKTLNSEAQWQKRLTPEQYAVLRQKATEPPFSGALNFNDKKGTYNCAACGAELFDSEAKFSSNSGWPSFYDAKKDAVKFTKDISHDMERTEVSCAQCGGHLGHVFDDAPDQPMGRRFCVNSVSLDFRPKG